MSTKALLVALFDIFIFLSITKGKKRSTKAMKLLPQFAPKETMESKQGYTPIIEQSRQRAQRICKVLTLLRIIEYFLDILWFISYLLCTLSSFLLHFIFFPFTLYFLSFLFHSFV